MKNHYNLATSILTSILTSLVNKIEFTKGIENTLNAEVDFVYKDINIKYNFTYGLSIAHHEPNFVTQEKKDLMTQVLVDSIIHKLSDTEKNISESEGHKITYHNYLDVVGAQEFEFKYYMIKSILEFFASKDKLHSSLKRNDELLTSLHQEFKSMEPLSFFDSSHPLQEYIQKKKEVK